jgi:hypothetical protein
MTTILSGCGGSVWAWSRASSAAAGGAAGAAACAAAPGVGLSAGGVPSCTSENVQSNQFCFSRRQQCMLGKDGAADMSLHSEQTIARLGHRAAVPREPYNLPEGLRLQQIPVVSCHQQQPQQLP